MSDINPTPVVIIPKDEYDRLVAAAEAMPVMESIKKFRAADAVWGLRTIERRAAVGEWDEIVITGSRPTHNFKDHGGPDWEVKPPEWMTR